MQVCFNPVRKHLVSPFVSKVSRELSDAFSWKLGLLLFELVIFCNNVIGVRKHCSPLPFPFHMFIVNYERTLPINLRLYYVIQLKFVMYIVFCDFALLSDLNLFQGYVE